MLWYPYLRAGDLSPEMLEEATRRGRRERAEMLSTLTTGLAAAVGRGFRGLLRGLAQMQERRARVALARNLMHPAISGYQAAARREIPGSVYQILSQPEARPESVMSSQFSDDSPRLAA
jgi:hypothetical protein